LKTTELFVEQVLIGFLVLLIAALPFVGAIPPEMPGILKIIGSAIGAVGVAYLLGIPFDRFADSVFSSLEKRIRLKLSIKHPVPGSEDPFPEDLLKIAVLQASTGTVAWMEYLRSRMRLTRAVAVFAPGLTLSTILATWPGSEQGLHLLSAPRWAVVATLGSSCIIYAMALSCALRAEKALPRTNELWDRSAEQRTSASFSWKNDPVPRMLLAFIAIGVFLAMISQSWLCALVGVVGLLITLLTGWSWRRITKTYMRFLAGFRRWQQQQPTIGTQT
jgi:hypothetical protein